MKFSDVTKEFLKDHYIKVEDIRCAFIGITISHEFNDLAYAPDEYKTVVLKEPFTSEELKSFWKELNFYSVRGETCVGIGRIWLKNDFYCFYDSITKKWNYVYFSKIPEECKRG